MSLHAGNVTVDPPCVASVLAVVLTSASNEPSRKRLTAEDETERRIRSAVCSISEAISATVGASVQASQASAVAARRCQRRPPTSVRCVGRPPEASFHGTVVSTTQKPDFPTPTSLCCLNSATRCRL